MCEIGISLSLEDSVRSSLPSEPSWIQNWMHNYFFIIMRAAYSIIPVPYHECS